MNLLILLVGSNPLPNYIVGCYLNAPDRAEMDVLPKPDKTILVYSKDTKKLAERIRAQLGIQPDYIDLKSDERNPSAIVKGIQDKLDALAKAQTITTIHLNYTGGTKPMSVYVHIGVSEWLDKTNQPDHIRLILSDIDPNNHKIVLRQKPDYPLSGDLRDWVKITTRTLLELHDMKIHCAGVQATTIPEDRLKEFACQAIRKFKNREITAEKLNKLFDDIKIRRWENHKKEQEIEKQADKFRAIVDTITKDFLCLTDFFEIYRGNYPKLTFIEFVKGKWLEDVILNSLSTLKHSPAVAIDELGKGIEAEYANRPTEVDVVAIRGYNLFLFSCTTSHGIKSVKQKAFEAIYRAEQLGGEHAKAIVVSLMDNLEELRKDLVQFDAARNCRLIGIDDIQEECDGKGSLTRRLKRIIMGVE